MEGKEEPTENSNVLQEFLDTHQYTLNGIKRYEFIFGDGYISSGGYQTTKELAEMLKLKKGCRVLDIGCGIGGGCEYIASKFECYVHGIDLSNNVINIAKNKYANRNDVSFEVADACTVDLPSSSYDVIYSRDCILHLNMKQKIKLLQNCYKWLKPTGQIFITDYCCGEKSSLWTDEFARYVDSRGYTLLTIAEYAALLEEAGFVVEVKDDITERWLAALTEEKEKLVANRQNFLAEFSEADYDDLYVGWKKKVLRAEEKRQIWGRFSAIKP